MSVFWRRHVQRERLERRRAQAVLQQSEERYRLLVETMNEGLAVLDGEGCIRYVNNRFCEMLGSTRQELLGRLHLELVAAVQQPRQQRRFLAGQADGAPYAYETDLVRRDGSQVPVILSARPLFSSDGQPAGSLAVFTDIGERRRADEALAASAERLRLALDSANEGLWDWDVPSGRAYFGPRYYTMLGYEPGEFPPSYESFERLLHPDDVAPTRALLASYLASNAAEYAIEFRMRSRCGETRWILSRGQVVARDAQGRAVRMVGTHSDITARKVAEEARRESEERYRSLVRQATEGIVIADRRGVVIEWNGAEEEMTGVSQQEALGQYIWDIQFRLCLPGKGTREQYGLLREGCLQALNTGQAPWFGRHVVQEILRPDGMRRALDILAYPIKLAQGVMIGSISHDITERQRLEEQLRQAHKMEAVGRLAGGIAHDFNNLLTVINGYSEMLLASVEASSAVASDLQQIRAAGERAASLTGQLLAFSRRQVLEMREINLNEVLGSMSKLLTRHIGEDVRLAFHPGANLGSVRADPGQIEQVVMNLAVNSRDAMPTGGLLTIETANVELGSSYTSEDLQVRPGSYVLLAIGDTGQGMAPEVREHLFEPFFTTKEQGKGTGLGLAMVYGIVKQSGGEVAVESSPGCGTTFYVYLPRVGEVSTETEQGAATAPLGGQETILVLEDEEVVRRLAARLLRGLGYTVVEACDGDEALRLWQGGGAEIDMVLANVVMPTLSGREFVERLRQSRPGFRVLYMSGYAGDAARLHGPTAEEPALLQKPFTLESLGRAVRRALAGQQGE